MSQNQVLAGQISGLSAPGMVNLADTTLGSSATNVTFSSIVGTYKDARQYVSSRGDGAVTSENVLFQFNSDTGANYDWSSTAARSVAQTATVLAIQEGASATASVPGVGVIDLFDYASTTLKKSFVSSTGNVDGVGNTGAPTILAGSWRSTAAITAIKTFASTSTNFVTGSRFTLQGVQ